MNNIVNNKGDTMMVDMDFTEITEGKTRFLVPSASLTAKIPPKFPAFFNLSARINRDLSIIAYKAFVSDIREEKSFADSFTGIGARALRVAVEVPEIEQVYANDINTVAVQAAKKSAELNCVTEKCNFSTNEVCKFLTDHATTSGERFTIVDLDPFGTPAKYVDCLLRSVLDRGLISVTATDNPVLCGIYPDVCSRRYYGRPLNSSYCNETAIRLLLSLIALTASRLELGIHPLFAHSNIHYFRVYAKVWVSSSKANKVLDSLGYVLHCFSCGNRYMTRLNEESGVTGTERICKLCTSRLSIGGPLWINGLHDKDFVTKMSDFDQGKQYKKTLDASVEELQAIPYYFRADEISSRLKTSPRTITEIIERLHKAGLEASRTSLNSSAFKTDARIDQILDIIKQ